MFQWFKKLFSKSVDDTLVLTEQMIVEEEKPAKKPTPRKKAPAKKTPSKKTPAKRGRPKKNKS
jgi:hypothetical protein